MPLYETTFIARQDISTADVDKLTETMSSVVTELGGNVVKKEYWGLRSLAYKIYKSRKGHYTMLAIDAPVAAIKELERKLKINDDVMRQLTIRVESISEEPSVVLQQAAGRDERSDREFGGREGGNREGGNRDFRGAPNRAPRGATGEDSE